MASHHPELVGSDFEQAYMLAGLHVVMALDPGRVYRFEGFSEPVWTLARRVLATCHPDVNAEVAEVAKRMWPGDEDRRLHFALCGAALRRLATSARFWSGQGSHTYAEFVLSLLTKTGWQPDPGRIHITVGGTRPPA